MGKARAFAKPPQVTLDAGALIAIDRGDRRMIALLDQVVAQGGRFHVPAGVLGQVFRDGRRQATLSRFIRAQRWKRLLSITICRAPAENSSHRQAPVMSSTLPS